MVLRSLVLLTSADGVTFTRHVQRHTDSRRSLSAAVITERAWALCIRRLVVQQVEILRNSEQPLLRLDFNECVCVWLASSSSQPGRESYLYFNQHRTEGEGGKALPLSLSLGL